MDSKTAWCLPCCCYVITHKEGSHMFCTYCGTKLEDDSKFCYNCGKKVIKTDMSLLSSEDAFMNPISTVDPNTYADPNLVVDSFANETSGQRILDEEKANSEETVNSKEPTSLRDETLKVTPFIELAKVSDIEISVVCDKFCAYCGVRLEEGAAFCYNCGNAVSEEVPAPSQPSNTEQSQPIQGNSSYQPPLSIPKEKDKKDKEGKAQRKGLFVAIILMCILVLGLGGYVIYTKITLGNLGDSVAAFKTLVEESGLENVEEYASLIDAAENKSNSLFVFGASDLEDQIKKATKECTELSEELILLKAKRGTYENLDQELIVDTNTDATIRELLIQFDTEIENGEKEKAEEILGFLEEERQKLITDNRIYVSSLLDEARNYKNEDFSEEDYNSLNNQIIIAENYMTAHDFISAKEQALSLSVIIAEMEVRIQQEKEKAALAVLTAKPERLVVMLPDVIYSDHDYRQEFEAALEDKLGLDIVFNVSSSTSYYDAVDTALSSRTVPDVVYLSQDMYKEFAAHGYLADITEYWENSELRYSSNFSGEAAMQRLMIDGHLYGFTPTRGYTCVTYVRKSWLDELGLQVPTNYEQFESMLKAFTENKMGNTKKASDTYGMTAPGLLNDSEPYISYLQQFYQNATAEIYQNYLGEWIDGFSQPEMVEALSRLQAAYAFGYLDKDIANNTVDDAIAAFGAGECGVISLWEGDGGDYLLAELEKNGIKDELIVLDPLVEMGSYVGKEPPVFAVTNASKSPGGIVKYFFEPMLDGGDVQRLWTYGVQGFHWNDVAQTVQYTEDVVIDYEEGQFHVLPYSGLSFITYNYNFIDPLLALADIQYGNDGMSEISEIAKTSSEVANSYYEASSNVKYNETYWYSFGDIYNYRIEAIQKIVIEGANVEATIAEYEVNVNAIMSQVLSELNQSE